MSIFKLIIIIFSFFLSIGYGVTLIDMALPFNLNQPSIQYFLVGFGIFIPLWLFWLRSNQFYSTFEHELTHLLVGLLFLKKPAHFTVTSHEGGETGLYGKNFLITLAPYFIPTFAYLLLPFYLIINSEYHLPYFTVLGFMVSYHVLSTIQEFSYRQPDIATSGKLFSTIFLIFANIFVYGFLIMFTIGGFATGGQFIRAGFLESIYWLSHLVSRMTG